MPRRHRCRRYDRAICRIGIYRLSDNSDVDIAPGDEGRLRWRRKDGTSGALGGGADGSWSSTLGWTERPDGKQVSFSECDAGEIRFDGLQGKRIALDVTQTRFQSGGIDLAGRLVMPKGPGPVPIVVLVHRLREFVGARLLRAAAIVSLGTHRRVRLRQARHGSLRRRIFTGLRLARERCRRRFA